MKTSLRKQFLKITIWITIIILFSFGILGLDIFFLQKHPVIWLSNYSDVVLEIWATQATIASLTLASTAFILGKIEDIYYGISVKDLLHLSKKHAAIGLSFWDKNICSIIIPAITLMFVVIDNIAVVTFLFLFTVYLAASILYECINIITKSEMYSTWAKQIIDKLVDTIISDNKKIDDKQKEIAKKHLSTIIDGIQREISLEINKKTALRENDTYWYFVRLMDRYSDETMMQINEQMHDILIDWLSLSINVKSEPNIRTIFHCSYPDSLTSRWSATGINIFMSSYYNGDISNSFFENEMESISNYILQAHDDYSAKALYVLRNAVRYADERTFVRILKAVWRSNPYDNPKIKSNVIITAMAYLYYMAYKEQYMPIEKGYQYVEKLRAFSYTTFLESYRDSGPKQVKDILSNTELVLDGVSFLLSFFNDRAFNWEFISLGEVKSARLGNDTIEFLTFYCYLFLKHPTKDDFDSIPLDVLYKMKKFINDEGKINEKYLENYSIFCKWLSKEMEIEQINYEINIVLIEAIKTKMLDNSKKLREKREVWTEKIDNMKNDIIQRLSKSTFFSDEQLSSVSYVPFRFSDFHSLNDFAEDSILYGNEQYIHSVFENWLFNFLQEHNILKGFPVHKKYEDFENDVSLFLDKIHQMDNEEIHIDQYYNFAFFDKFSHREKTSLLSKKLQEINSRLKKIGTWDTYYWGISMHVDSSLAKIGFWIPHDEFLTITEELTESEIKYVCQKYKTANGIVYHEASNSIGIPFTEEELVEYLKNVMIKISYRLPVELPCKRIGLFTYEIK